MISEEAIKEFERIRGEALRAYLEENPGSTEERFNVLWSLYVANWYREKNKHKEARVTYAGGYTTQDIKRIFKDFNLSSPGIVKYIYEGLVERGIVTSLEHWPAIEKAFGVKRLRTHKGLKANNKNLDKIQHILNSLKIPK